jgi:hypothetical protein
VTFLVIMLEALTASAPVVAKIDIITAIRSERGGIFAASSAASSSDPH